jgi:hypothetical protein
MRGTTCFQPDPGRRQPIEELPHLAASELTADNRLLVLIDAVHLKDMLGGIQANSDNRHGTAPLLALQTSQPGTTDAVGAVHPNITVSVVRGEVSGRRGCAETGPVHLVSAQILVFAVISLISRAARLDQLRYFRGV